jgi:hypothetical protein
VYGKGNLVPIQATFDGRPEYYSSLDDLWIRFRDQPLLVQGIGVVILLPRVARL